MLPQSGGVSKASKPDKGSLMSLDMKLENHYICEPLLLTKLYFICSLVRPKIEPHNGLKQLLSMISVHLILPVTL